jgi:ABC-type glycerol-3-phosphate transport system substrate-binding protein
VTYPYLIFFNLDALTAAGVQPPPASPPAGARWMWDQFLDMARRATRREGDKVTVYGHLNAYGAGTRFLPLMWQHGGGVWKDPDQRTTLGFDLPGTIEAMQFVGDLAAKHQVLPPPGEAGFSFDNGNVAMVYTSSFDLVGADQRWKFAWTAAYPPQKTKRVTCAITNGWAIAKAGRQPEAAWQLVRWLSAKDGQTVLVQNNLLSIWKELNASSAYTTVPPAVRAAIQESTEQSRGIEDIAHPAVADWLNKEWPPALNDLLKGTSSAKALFEDWQRRYQPQVAAYDALYK